MCWGTQTEPRRFVHPAVQGLGALNGSSESSVVISSCTPRMANVVTAVGIVGLWPVTCAVRSITVLLIMSQYLVYVHHVVDPVTDKRSKRGPFTAEGSPQYSIPLVLVQTEMRGHPTRGDHEQGASTSRPGLLQSEVALPIGGSSHEG